MINVLENELIYLYYWSRITTFKMLYIGLIKDVI
jgi:hypothetical protein